MNVSQFLAVKKALALDMLQKQGLLISQAAPARQYLGGPGRNLLGEMDPAEIQRIRDAIAVEKPRREGRSKLLLADPPVSTIPIRRLSDPPQYLLPHKNPPGYIGY